MQNESNTLLAMADVIYNSWIFIVALGYVYICFLGWKILSPTQKKSK